MSNQGNGSGNGKRTLVDEGTEFRGSLSSSSTIVVLGKVEGEISGPAVEVAETGVLSGRIKVGELRCRGELAGELDAESVQLSGRVRDQTVIRAKALEVAGGRDVPGQGVQFGECELSIGEAPDRQAAIDKAQSAPTAATPASPAAQPAAAAATEAAPEPVEASERSRRSRGNGATRRPTAEVEVPKTTP
jgi:cytoskeletal protein CcmA (bactofilin family)